jgi:UDP-glucose 4-epimerase
MKKVLVAGGVGLKAIGESTEILLSYYENNMNRTLTLPSEMKKTVYSI